MKIIIDARLYGLEHAGLGRYVMSLVESLKALDYENEYIVLLRRKYYEKLTFPKNWRKILFDFRHYTFGEQIFLPFVLYKNKPDIVHFPHFNVPILYFGKFVVTIHDTLMHRFVGGEATTLPWFFYLIRRIGYKIAFYKAVVESSAVIVPSKYVKRDVMSIYRINKNKVYVTYEGFDQSVFNWIYEKRANTILKNYGLKANEYFIYSGNAYPHKNLSRLVSAMTILNDKLKWKAKLAITTSRSIFLTRLKKDVSASRATEYVRLLGFVSEADYKVLLNHSIAFVFPSLSEGFGLPGVEAIASGTLLVCSDIPVFREVYGNHAIYFDANDEFDISRKMMRVIDLSTDKSTKRFSLIKGARKYALRYSWEKMAGETLLVYKKFASEKF